MDLEYIIEPEDGLIRYGPEVLQELREENNLSNKENREKSIAIIDDWIKSQDHLIKKDFSKGYIERCISTSKSSIERAKQQIDRLCTMKTLMPKYFQTVNLKESELMGFLNKGHVAFIPRLTKEYYRTVMIKANPNVQLTSLDFTLLFKLFIVIAEFCKSNDCCRGYYFILDIHDINVRDIITKINLIELQQFLPILTEGYGLKIKGIFLVTSSRFVEGLINMLKPLFSEKIRSRIHAVSSRSSLQQYINGDLPSEYDGMEKSLDNLHEDFVESLSGKRVQELLREMNKAATDESKRQVGKFNEKYMGMSGTFRTLSLD